MQKSKQKPSNVTKQRKPCVYSIRGNSKFFTFNPGTNGSDNTSTLLKGIMKKGNLPNLKATIAKG